MAGILEAAFTGVGALSQAKTSLWEPFVNTIASSNDMEKIHELLNRAVSKLCTTRDDHEEKLQRQRVTHMPSKTYNNWIQEVTRIEDEVQKMNTKYNAKCKKSRVKIVTRLNFCEKMKKKIVEILNLLVEGTQIGDILVPKKYEQVVETITPNIKNFPALQKPLNEILDCLTIKKIKGIRIHGMMGIGKTTILENLNNHEKVAEMFDLVIWVKVSTEENKKNFTTDEIQQAVIRRLKLNMESTGGCDEVARRLREELNDKKFLLLLDGVKEDLNLDEIGINPNYKTGSKIVLATRFGHVCSLIADINIKVGRLSQKEAEKMFQSVLGQSKHKVGPIMRQVVKRCDGLPFAIKMVASAFKMRDTEERWSDGLLKLRQWPEKEDNAMTEMCKLLDFCCNHLEGTKKDCFLYAALYPEDNDIHIDCLLDCWAAEDLYDFPDDPKIARANGRNILDDLKMVSLLEEGVGTEYVRMHKLIRQVALCELSDKHLVKTNESLKVPPSVELWKQKKWISLVDNNLRTVPEGLECSVLSTLFLQKNPSLKRLPTLFFGDMKNLRVLSLYGTGIASLPSSLSNLGLLKVLYLNGCADLVELCFEEILKLSSLQVLDVRGSGFKNIAPNIENLRHLRRLLVSFNICGDENDTREVTHFCNVISKISPTLEELVIDVNSCKQRCNKMVNVVRDKVAGTLENLTTLKFRFEDGVEDVIKVVAGTPKTYYPIADNLTSFVAKINDSKSSGSFQVFIGCSISSSPRIPKLWLYDSYLKYCNGNGFNRNISKVLAKTDAFELVNHNELEHVSQFEIASLLEVKGFLIEGCNNVTEIVDGKYMVDRPVLLNLLRLYIKKLPRLNSIWNAPVDLRSLSNLRTLKIGECCGAKELLIDHRNTAILPKLRKLVVYNMPTLVRICANISMEWPSLEKLKIHGCPDLKELPFGKDNAVKLRKLILLELPNLTRICTYEPFEWHALEKIKIYGCTSLTMLPFNGCNAQKLSFIEAEQKWWKTLEWQDPKVEERLQAYCSPWNLQNEGLKRLKTF
ncbi:hypothetical protein LguiB_006630 [Lonicera macranthoides]